MRAYTRTTLFICILGLMGIVSPTISRAQSADVPPASYYLEAYLNGRPTGLVVQVDRTNAGLRISADELTEIGVRVDDLPLDADRQILLADIPGLAFNYVEDTQRIEFTLPEAGLVPEQLGVLPPPPTLTRSGTGLVLNYAAQLQNTRVAFEEKRQGRRLHVPLLGSARYGRLPVLGAEEFEAQYERRNRTFALSTELRFFSPAGVFVNTGYTTVQAGEYDYIRQDSYWTYTQPDALRTYTAGDLVSSSLTWSRAIHLGGLSVSRNFEVRPNLVTFPVPAIGGTAVVPTMVDLYINGLRQFTGNASGGPFLIAAPPALTGAGIATVVYQDAMGREVSLSRPLYIDTRLLGRGLYDYSVEVGYPRRSYGSRSFDYADDPAANASWRHGVRDGFTLEAHTELTRGLYNLGIGGLVELGNYGVLNASATISDGDQHGMQWGLGYQYQSPHFNIDLLGLRADGGYRDLGSLKDVTVPQRQLHASLGVPLGQRHSVTLVYTRQQASDLGGSHILSIGYNGSFGQRLSVFANVFHDRDVSDSLGIYLGASLSLERRASVASSASRYGKESTASISASRSMDYDRGGFGWSALLDGGDDGYRHGMGRVDYRGTYGDASLLLEHSTRDDFTYTNATLFATGALVWIDGDLLASRTISDAFAVVSTNGMADIPILRENRLVGATNREGHLLIPDLLSWQSNRLMLGTVELPPDVRVDADRMEVAPRGLSGVLAAFPVGHYTGAVVILVDERGQPLPVGTTVTVTDSGLTATMGYDGQVFIEQLGPRQTVSAEANDATCTAEVLFDAADVLTTIGPFVCKSSQVLP
ncbi:fimbria/pilus outer membrane usher protein [Lysobacter sp. MMG2]|uniref:fimbria/pilus outer membrane usher protein n=1 Tax=Lysobacter sp. MMG2 TaxID=2801338 RepID=UPI001C2155BF|nr:fimbria/pilus outer membrane usher protein [Lysobacter sp. MMG2]MBU8974752.1 fimbria/pilus outer membrane usher protein [Lysobacter sp. MMG2]